MDALSGAEGVIAGMHRLSGIRFFYATHRSLRNSPTTQIIKLKYPTSPGHYESGQQHSDMPTLTHLE